MEQVADGVYRLGSYWVNFYLVEDGGSVTLVDTGFPGYASQVDAALEQLGRTVSDVKAIVLTHTHPDHIGGAEVLLSKTGAPVLVPGGEAGWATGEDKPVAAKGFLPNLWRPHILRFLGHGIANKGASRTTVPEVVTYRDDEVLDVPGAPRVVFTPGHSEAHCALLLEGRKVLFCGDALATLAVHTGATGAMVHPFNQDRDGAIRSLDVLEPVAAAVLLPGHGDPWRGPTKDAVAAARGRL